MNKTHIDVENIIDWKNKLVEINKLDMNEIDLYKDGKKIQMDPEKIRRWELTGLTVSDFIYYKFYK